MTGHTLGVVEQRSFRPFSRQVAVIGQGSWYIDEAHGPPSLGRMIDRQPRDIAT
jgi:hypothetical protein